jgi:NADH-quinone oxidoreductase subunit B
MFESDKVPESEIHRNVLLTTVDAAYNWGRTRSMWPVGFGLACCAFEMIAGAAARYDIARFGMEFFRASPRQADLLILAGTITHKMAPQVLRIWNQMAEPKYCLAMGSCAISGGMFRSYAVLQGADEILPVDIFVPGCPPRPEALFQGIMKLHDKVRKQSVTTVHWYGKPGREPQPRGGAQ